MLLSGEKDGEVILGKMKAIIEAEPLAKIDYVDMVKCYRSLRPDGKIYMELDINLQAADRTPWRSEKVAAVMEACDVIGASCRSMQQYMMRKTPYKVEYIPNGFYDFESVDFTPDFSRKEKIILTVGRIGTHQKHNESADCQWRPNNCIDIYRLA